MRVFLDEVFRIIDSGCTCKQLL